MNSIWASNSTYPHLHLDTLTDQTDKTEQPILLVFFSIFQKKSFRFQNYRLFFIYFVRFLNERSFSKIVCSIKLFGQKKTIGFSKVCSKKYWIFKVWPKKSFGQKKTIVFSKNFHFWKICAYTKSYGFFKLTRTILNRSVLFFPCVLENEWFFISLK